MKYPEIESNTLEFKREITSNDQIIKCIIGFLNLYGGKLIIGVDNNREIIGIDESKVYQTLEHIEKTIYDNCSPVVVPHVYTRRMANKLILIIEVSSGTRKPYFKISEGLNKGVYVRIGRSSMRATPELIEDLKNQGLNRSFDSLAVYNNGPEALSEMQLKEFFGTLVKYPKRKINTDLLTAYNLLMNEQQQVYPTAAGVLLFGFNPQEVFTEAFIICTHFAGTRGRQALASRDIKGTLFQQFEESFALIKSRLNVAYKIKGKKRVEELEIPEVAIREVLVNALVHRNYSIKAPIKIAIYDDRIEFFSPGIFPGPLKVDKLEDGITYIRNSIITKIFREAGLVEKLGSGFLTLFESYRERGLLVPEVIEGDSFVKCILPRGKSEKGIVTGYEKRIINLCHKLNEITTQDVMRELAVSRATASKELSKLSAAQKLVKVGNGPRTRYRFK